MRSRDPSKMGAPCQLVFDDQPTKQSIIVNIRVGTASLSFLGSLFVILTIWLFKKYVVFTQRLILYLGFAALLSSTAYIVGRIGYESESTASVNERRFCRFQGFILLYTDWALLLNFTCVAFNLFWNVICNKRTEQFEIPYLLISFLLPSIIACIPFSDDSFGPSGAWCWIKQKDYVRSGNSTNSTSFTCQKHHTGNILGFVLWYIPLFFILITMLITYAIVVCVVRRKINVWQGTFDPVVEQQKTHLKHQIKPLILYPVVYILVSLFPAINRVYDIVKKNDVFALWILHVIFSPLAGALVAIVMYGVERDTFKRYRLSSVKAAFRSKFAKDTTCEYPVYVEEVRDKENDNSRSDDDECNVTKPLM